MGQTPARPAAPRVSLSSLENLEPRRGPSACAGGGSTRRRTSHPSTNLVRLLGPLRAPGECAAAPPPRGCRFVRLRVRTHSKNGTYGRAPRVRFGNTDGARVRARVCYDWAMPRPAKPNLDARKHRQSLSGSINEWDALEAVYEELRRTGGTTAESWGTWARDVLFAHAFMALECTAAARRAEAEWASFCKNRDESDAAAAAGNMALSEYLDAYKRRHGNNLTAVEREHLTKLATAHDMESDRERRDEQMRRILTELPRPTARARRPRSSKA